MSAVRFSLILFHMFVVSEAETALIQAAWESGGELAAAVELRRLFPGVSDMAHARRCARAVASWRPVTPIQPQAD